MKRHSSKDDSSDRKDRHRPSSHRKATAKDNFSSRTSLSPTDPKRRSSMPGMTKEESASCKTDSKASLPYPSFSKQHSKEAVGPRVSLNIFTPPATDLNVSKDQLPAIRTSGPLNAPPSPPLTDEKAGRWKSNTGKPVSVETIVEEDGKPEKDDKVRPRLQPKLATLDGRSRSASEVGSSPARKPREKQSTPLKSRETRAATPPRTVSQPTRTRSPAVQRAAQEDDGNISSDGTSIAPEQPNIQRPGSKIPPAATLSEVQLQVTSLPGSGQSRGLSPLEVFADSQSPQISPASGTQGPPPPPPLPVISIPRVDYLLQYGGLNQNVPKNLLLAGKPMAVQQAAASGQSPVIVSNLFEPYHHLLDDFERVMEKSGSLSVATGYRSVARRLLDRLEAVFARDISNEFCRCAMCENDLQDGEDVRGVSWGEILELVSGRRDLPNWPPFSFVASPVGLGISLEMHTPMQKLDIDMPEEYREHYIRQSRKTKQSVDKWLNRQNDAPSNPPEEVDDETLTFAILTHLPAEQRQVFKNLLQIEDRPLEPPRRAPSPEKGASPAPIPTPRPRPDDIVTAGFAIQRLYRLASVPRDPETAIFLLNNPTLHNALATLAAVSNEEWDILISGRFDGFLRSGAEDAPDYPSRHPSQSRPASRTTTPASTNHLHAASHSRQHSGSISRTTTPASGSAQYGAPIALDEETEIATLAEIERDIYTGMEALEDAFETLHLKAETVRRVLRERSAGLAAAVQRRRGANGSVEVRLGTPSSNAGLDDGRWELETDDGLGDWDGISELAPDDSASNISTHKKRRPKRRNERRTPMIEEGDEEEYEGSEGTMSPKKN